MPLQLSRPKAEVNRINKETNKKTKNKEIKEERGWIQIYSLHV